MLKLKNLEYITNEKGQKIKVILDYASYLQMLNLLQDLKDSNLIKKTKSEPEISLEEYKRKRKFV